MKRKGVFITVLYILLVSVAIPSRICGVEAETTESLNLLSNTDVIRILFDERNLEYEEETGQYQYSIENTNSFGYSKIAGRLKEQGYEISRLLTGKITLGKLRNNDILVLIPTSNQYTEEEIDAIVSFVESGGSLLQLGDPSERDVLKLVSRRFDVHYPQKYAVLVDHKECFPESGTKDLYVSFYEKVLKITDFSVHPITEGIESVYFCYITFLELHSKGDILAKSSPSSSAHDRRGPFIVLLATQKGKGRAVFSTDEDFIRNRWIDFLDNEQLALNIFRWLSESSNPCEDIICHEVCKGVDLYSQECVNGNCVVNKLIESNSVACGYDPCENKNCPESECYNYDLWSVKCVDGECERNYIIEKNSEECGYYESTPPPSTLELPPVSTVDSSYIVIGGILTITFVSMLTIYWMKFKRKQEVKIPKEKLKIKLEEDYVEDRISREEYLRRKKELEKW